jgi:hypothetical protein
MARRLWHTFKHRHDWWRGLVRVWVIRMAVVYCSRTFFPKYIRFRVYHDANGPINIRPGSCVLQNRADCDNAIAADTICRVVADLDTSLPGTNEVCQRSHVLIR